MKTPFDQLSILYQALAGSGLDAALTGGLYLLKRPVGSELEDAVINSLPVSVDQIQRGTANVNIYVPDLTAKINGKPQLVPDVARLKILTDLTTPILDERVVVNTGKYGFWITDTQVMEEVETGQHYMNIRIDFQFFPN